MSCFAIGCDVGGRINTVLHDDAGVVPADAVGRMASVLFAPTAVMHFYDMLVEVEERGVLCGWRFTVALAEAAVYWLSAARDQGSILIAGHSEASNGDAGVRLPRQAMQGGILPERIDQAVGYSSRGRHHLAAFLRRVVGDRSAGNSALQTKLAGRIVARLTDDSTVLADMALQVEALQRLNAMPQQLDNELVRMAAHDLRNPLLVVSMNCSYLLDQNRTLSASERGLLSDSLEMCDHIGRFLDGMRSLSGFSVGRFDLVKQATEVGGVVRQLVARSAISARHSQITIGLDRADSIQLSVDDNKLSCAVVELLNNVVKHCPPGTTARVSVEQRGRDAVIAVADDGPGIDPAAREKLFHPFGKLHNHVTRTGGYGAGVGLAIVRRVTEAYGGRVEVESEPGQGARFEMILPLPPPRR
ncbi:MAG: HAMP domain-containing histidine kinase [Proteobacteria bacterium]|nr:HAMP domain-containing histidine kinase [Pseudomonadota bacterium]